MALISFGYRVDMYAPSLLPTDPAGYIVAYDLDGVLKQKNYQGVVTLVGSGAGGPQGPPGPVGPAGLTWSGAWVATQSYSVNYAVGYASASWWCISGVTGATGNDSPDIDTTHWTLLAAQGSPGSQGAQGEHGLDGPQGPTGSQGATGSPGNKGGLLYEYGSGMSFNNPDPSLVTEVSFNDITEDGANVGNYINSWQTGGTLVIQSNTNGDSTYTIFNVNAVVITPIFPGGGILYQVGVSYIEGTTPTTGEICVANFSFNGPQGATGFGVTSSFYLQGTTDYSYDTTSDIYRSGSLAIGTSASSTSKLYIYATQSGGLQLEDGTQGDSYILVSDPYGIATWTASVPFLTGSYSVIQTLVDNSQLVPEKQYVINDYVHKYYIENTNTSNIKTYKTVSSITSNFIILNGTYEYNLILGMTVTIESLPVGYSGTLVVGQTTTVSQVSSSYYFRFANGMSYTSTSIGVVLSFGLPRFTTLTSLIGATISDTNLKVVMKPGGLVNTDVHDGTIYGDMSALENFAPPVEKLLLRARTSNTFYEEAESLTFKNDKVIYDINDSSVLNDNLEVISTRNGFVSRRFNDVLNIDIDKDWRTQKYRRWLLPMEYRSNLLNLTLGTSSLNSNLGQYLYTSELIGTASNSYMYLGKSLETTDITLGASGSVISYGITFSTNQINFKDYPIIKLDSSLVPVKVSKVKIDNLTNSVFIGNTTNFNYDLYTELTSLSSSTFQGNISFYGTNITLTNINGLSDINIKGSFITINNVNFLSSVAGVGSNNWNNSIINNTIFGSMKFGVFLTTSGTQFSPPYGNLPNSNTQVRWAQISLFSSTISSSVIGWGVCSLSISNSTLNGITLFKYNSILDIKNTKIGDGTIANTVQYKSLLVQDYVMTDSTLLNKDILVTSNINNFIVKTDKNGILYYDNIDIITSLSTRFYYDNTTKLYTPTNSNSGSIFYIQGGTSSAFGTTSSIYRTGSINIGTGSATDGRFVVSSSGGTVSLVVSENGRVSIGGTLSSHPLTVYGNAQVTNFFYTHVTQVSSAIIFDGGGNTGIKRNNLGLEFFNFATSSSAIRFTNNSSGTNTGEITMLVDVDKKYVGIGTSSPSTTLHVYATQSGVFRLEDTTQGPGYVLTSDANGVATWASFSSSNWYAENATPPTTTPVATGEGSVAFGNAAQALGSNMFVYGDNAGRTNPTTGTVNYSILLGRQVAKDAKNVYNSVFIGENVGLGADGSHNSNFLGQNSGRASTNSNNSNFLGQSAGENSLDAEYSNFLGFAAGKDVQDSSYSNLFGYSAGKKVVGNDIGKNNIIIGTNISLPNGTSNAINLGGVLFGTGTHFTFGNTPSIVAQPNGRIGINVVNPTTNLHVYGTQSGAFRLEDTTQGPGYVLTSDANGVASWTSSLAGLSLLGNSEVISTEVIATASVVVYDYSLSSLWYHGTASSNFTANFTNLPTTDNRVLSASIVINQGLNGYIPNGVQIEGVTQSVKWPGGTQSGTSYNLDIVTFNFIRTSGTWTNVIGQVASFT